MEEKERQILSQDFPKDFESPIVEKILDDVENVDKIKLPKKAIKKIESPFWQGYEVLFPASSKYAGYKTKISEYFISETPEYFLLKRIFGNATFTVEKAEREPGKRYKRYNIGWDELYIELAEYNEQFNRENLTSALVMFNDYVYSRSGFEQSRYREIAVAKHNETWCYVFDANGNEERHRISAKHFEIVKDNLTSEEEKKFTLLLEQKNDVENKLLDIANVERQASRFDLNKVKGTSIAKSWKEFIKSIEALKEELQERFNLIMKELGIEDSDAKRR